MTHTANNGKEKLKSRLKDTFNIDQRIIEPKEVIQTSSQVNLRELPRGYFFEGRYEIIKPLEKGSGGTVYLVRDCALECRTLHNPTLICKNQLQINSY